VNSVYTRREILSSIAAAALFPRAVLSGENGKQMRGIFIIMATPYNDKREVDYADLEREVDFLDRCGVQGMVWPQLASEVNHLTVEERMKGMEVLARAGKGRKPALVLGVQGTNTRQALQYLEQAEKLAPDAVIAIPPKEAKSLDDFREYYRALAGATNRPMFVQTTGGATGINPTIEFLVALAREFPHCAYVKEEYNPVIDRMKELGRHRPTIKGIFSGAAGRGMMYEMRLGSDGTMPAAQYSDVYAKIWSLYQSGQKEKALEVFGRLMLMINLEQHIPGMRQYVMKMRGVFKTTVSRQVQAELSPEAIREIEFTFGALKPHVKFVSMKSRES
jgi:4-hydroxy-tetrahydrodipicolinate synthase